MLPSAFRPCVLGAAVLLTASAAAQVKVTSRSDAVGTRLNDWYAAGTAAGLGDITYENRDGQHSPLNLALYPQLQVFQPDAKSGPPTGPAVSLRLKPTVGNCSMSAPADKGGSLPRMYQMDPSGQKFLMMQYLANNLMIYPEHQDYDPGANGIGGYGDLYPSNNACTLISQGSSGSDQPFLNAVLATLAAFPADTQRTLIEKRILMPTVQAIFRQSNKQVQKEADYFTAAAHPVVFDAASLDEDRMTTMAHEMRPPMIPPLVRIEVLEETPLAAGRDFFEAEKNQSWKLADTPVSIARVMRGNRTEHTMTISARKTADIMGRPVQLRWQLLQGDPRQVRLETSDKEPTLRLHIRWQPPIRTATGLRSHRVDIGVFASNGISTSAPAIISFYMLPNEMHFHDAEGRVSEIFYQAHNPDLGLPTTRSDLRWMKAMLAVSAEGQTLPARLMAKLLTAPERQAIQKAWKPLHTRWQAWQQAAEDPAQKDRAIQLKTRLEEAIPSALDEKLPGDRALTVQTAIEKSLATVGGLIDLFFSAQRELSVLAAQSPKRSAEADIAAEVARLRDLGIVLQEASGTVTTSRPADQLTPADRYAISGLNLTLLSQVLFPEVLERSTAPAWVDSRLATAKAWRDVHRYDDLGKHLGWIRHQGGRTAWFDTEGRHLPDGPKQPTKAQAVVYEKNAQGLLEWRAR